MQSLTEKAQNHECRFISAVLTLLDQHGVVELSPADFMDERLGKVWEYCQQVSDISITEVEYRFDQQKYISDMMTDHYWQAKSLQFEAAAIRELAHKRRIVKALAFATDIITNGKPIDEAANYALSAFDDAPSGGDGLPLKEYLKEAYSNLQKANEGESVNFIHTGIDSFDRLFGGLQKDGLVIVAGRPSMGKTAFASVVARNVSKLKPVLMISMEMTGAQLAMRFLSSENNVDLQHMMQGNLATEDWRKLASGLGSLQGNSHITINQKTSRSVADIAAEARRFKRKHDDVGLIVIDYLTLLKMPQGENQAIAVGKVSRALKVLAGDIGCPIMLISQLNRSLESRTDKRPMMSDLRDSGAIEQDADQIIFPFRAEVYDKKPDNEGKAELIVRKNRNGKIGAATIAWLAQSATFKDLHHGEF